MMKISVTFYFESFYDTIMYRTATAGSQSTRLFER